MSPVTVLGEVAVLALPADPTDQDIQAAQAAAGHASAREDVTTLVVDASNLLVADPFIAQALSDIGQGARLLGTRPVLAGLRAGPALVLANLGVPLTPFDTVRRVGDALT